MCVEMSPVVIVHRNTYVQAHRFFTAKYSTRKSTTLRAANNEEVLKQSLTTVYLDPRGLVSHKGTSIYFDFDNKDGVNNRLPSQTHQEHIHRDMIM
jgi:hypothetical protein